MGDTESEECVQVRPKPGVVMNVSWHLPSQANEACQNLEKVIRRRLWEVLDNRGVSRLTCNVLLVAVTVDILCTLCM